MSDELDIPLTLLDPDGGWINAPLHVHDLHGRPVLLHFWSTHDESLQEQLPQLLEWIREFAPRGLQVIGVHVPLDGEDLRKAMDTNDLEARAKQLSLHHPIAVDDGSMMAAYRVSGLPSYLIYDAFGKQRMRVSGTHESLRMVRQVLDRLTGPDATTGAFAP